MTKKSIIAVAATAMMALALSFGAGSAFADPDTTTQGQNDNTSNSAVGIENIDRYSEGIIDIHKKLNPTSPGKVATGEAEKDESGMGTPLEDVTFKAFRVKNADGSDLKLNEQKSWDSLKEVAPDKDLKKLTAEVLLASKKFVIGDRADKEGTTANGGITKLAVPVGVYVVKEDISAISAKVPGLTAGPDFLVFVPTTTTDGKAWDYTVTVYPKNTAGGITKTVVDADKNVGDDIVYKVDADIPAALDGKQLVKYELWDTIDTDKLDPANTDWGKSSSVAFVNNDPIEAKYYDLNFDNAQKTIKVVFKPEGLKMLQGKVGQKVRLTINAKVKAIGEGNGVIVNDSQLITHQPGAKNDTNTPSNKVVTYLGKVKVVKTSNGGREESQTLSGAKFELYQCTKASKEGLTTGPLTVNNKNSWTTDKDGVITIDGLHATNFENNVPVSPEKHYCLKEVQAPAGYVLPDNPITMFELTRSDTAGMNDKTRADFAKLPQLIKNLSIKNTKSDTPDLPLTGGQGIALLVILGAGVAGAAVYSARRNSTKA